MLVLKNGKIAEYGDTKSVLGNPQSEYTKKLLSAVPVLRR
jgi:ABC-type microcin C transport system duplicated ATPase subunit YejF